MQMRQIIDRIRGNEAGFTLIEMLIVVGIIVALAAAIVPQFVQFSDQGTEGAKSSEQSEVQAAIDNMMVGQALTAVTAPSGSVSKNVFTGSGVFGTGDAALYPTYLSIGTSTYFYCWDTTGKIGQQDTASASC